MNLKVHYRRPVYALTGLTALIFILLWLALLIEERWSWEFDDHITMLTMVWTGILLFVYLLILCGSVCCWSLCGHRCGRGYVLYLLWAAVMTMLFTWCFLTERLTFSNLLVMTPWYLLEQWIAGGVVMLLLHSLAPKGKDGCKPE